MNIHLLHDIKAVVLMLFRKQTCLFACADTAIDLCNDTSAEHFE